jgi:hypothetical protein
MCFAVVNVRQKSMSKFWSVSGKFLARGFTSILDQSRRRVLEEPNSGQLCWSLFLNTKSDLDYS